MEADVAAAGAAVYSGNGDTGEQTAAGVRTGPQLRARPVDGDAEAAAEMAEMAAQQVPGRLKPRGRFGSLVS